MQLLQIEQEQELDSIWNNSRTVTSTHTGAQWEREYHRNRSEQFHEEMDDYDQMINNTAANKGMTFIRR